MSELICHLTNGSSLTGCLAELLVLLTITAVFPVVLLKRRIQDFPNEGGVNLLTG